VNPGAFRDPQAPAAPLCGHLDRHPARERIVLGCPVGLERADVRPVEVSLVYPTTFSPDSRSRGNTSLAKSKNVSSGM
jgi:hypothetical protein